MRTDQPLPPREWQMAALVAQGKSNKQIGKDLLLTEGTVKEYMGRIFSHLEVSNRTAVAIWFVSQAKAAHER